MEKEEYNPETENLALGHAKADYFYKKSKQEKDKQNKLEKMTLFVNSSDQIGLNADLIFNNREDKERLIRNYGYSSLNYSGQQYKRDDPGIPLSQCSDAKIGHAFKKLYYSFKKQLKK